MSGKQPKLSDDLRKMREGVFHEKKGDCNSSCYDGCEACVLDRFIGMAEHLEETTTTAAGIGHVVGQGGKCWCGEKHKDYTVLKGS